MANRWIDSLGRYGGDEAKMLNGSSGQAWAQIDTAGLNLSNANPRTGNWHLRLTASGSRTEGRRVFGAPLTEAFVGFAVFCHDLPANETTGTTDGGLLGTYLCSLRDATNAYQCRVMLGTDGALEVRRDATVLGRSLPVIGAGAYQHVEVFAKAGNGDGAIEIRVDEVTVLNLTGKDTVATSNVEFSQFAFGHEAHIGGYADAPTIDFADIYCNDTIDDGSGCNWFVGDVKAGLLLVDADTAKADFTLSAGTQGYTLLGAAPPDDATYISTAVTAAESDFGLQDGPSNLSEILTVRPFIRAMKDDAGTCTVAPNMKSGSAKGTVAAQPVTTAFAYVDSNVPTDPATGVPWTASGLNAAKMVVERIA